MFVHMYVHVCTRFYVIHILKIQKRATWLVSKWTLRHDSVSLMYLMVKKEGSGY